MGGLGGELRVLTDSLGLAVRGLWWRKGVSIAVLVVATTTVLAAAIGPLYARAGSESILQDTLREATTRDVGVEIYQTANGGSTSLDRLDTAIDGASKLVGYAKSIHSLQITGVVLDRRGNPDAQSQVAYREGQCDHLVFTAGRCPQRANEIAVSARSLPEHAWPLGTVLSVRRLGAYNDPDTHLTGLRVVGLYRPKDPNEEFWFNQNYFNAHIAICRAECPNISDTLFTPRATYDAAPAGLQARALVDLPLDIPATRLRDTPRLRHQLSAFQTGLASEPDAPPAVTNLALVLDTAKGSARRLEVSVALVVGQLLLLSWLVLYIVVANAIEARGPEVALAKLRGLSPARTVAFGLLEPALLILLATPLGLLLGLLAVEGLSRLRLLPGTPVAMTVLGLVSTAAALAGALVAAVLAARRTLRRPVVEQWRRTAGEQRPSRRLVAFDLAVAVAAVAGLVQLRFAGALGHGRANDFVLLAPALVALALALLGVRLLPLACRVAVRRSRGSARLGRFVALRQVARRPGGLRVVALLAVAFGLTTFTVAAWSVASTNRSERAAAEVGAATVLTVDPAAGVDVLDVVRRLDPGGRAALAAAEYQPFSGEPGGRLVAVDAPRLPAVSGWRRDFAAEPLGRLVTDLHPRTAPSVTVKGVGIAVTVTASGLRGDGSAYLQADVRSPTAGAASVSLGQIRGGRHRYTGVIPACAAGCQLTGLGVPGGLGDFSPWSGRLMFSELATRSSSAPAWRPVDAAFSVPGRWTGYRLAPPGRTNTIATSSAGLSLTYAAELVAVPGVSPFDAPDVLPAVVTPAAVPGAIVGQPSTVTGLDGQALSVKVAAIARVLPRATDTGTMVDLEYADRLLGTGYYQADRQVWLSEHAPKDLVRRLEAAGVHVTDRHTAAHRRAVLGRQGPALALLLFLCVAGLAALLAAGATVVSVYLAGRRRAFELAAMSAIGVPRGQLLRACLGEQLLLLCTGIGIGIAAGAAGAALALPSMPIYSDGVTVPPLHFLPAPAPVGGFLFSAAALIASTGAVAAVLLVRSARPARLREAQA